MIKHSIKDITGYAKIRDLKYFLLFVLDFPFSVPLPPIVEMSLSTILFDPFQDRRGRHFAICSEYYWSESIDIPGREVVSAEIFLNKLDESVKYTQQSTRVKLILQVYEDEVDKTRVFLDKASYRSSLLIRILSILEIKLVEVKGFSFGSELMNYGADRVLFFKYDDNADQIRLIHSKISCNYSMDWSHLLSIGSNDFLSSDETCMWRYYANRCELAYNRKQNTDCVLYAAISIEAYIHQLMLNNNLIDSFDSIKNNDFTMLKKYKAGEMSVEEFLKSINGTSNYPDSVFGEVKFLVEKKVINNSTKKVIEKSFGRINQTRNAIVHGDMDSVLVCDLEAKKAYESMLCIFKNIDFDSPKNKQPNFYMINKQMEDVSIRCNQEDDSTEIEFQHFLENKYYYSFSCFNLGIINFRKKNYDASKSFFLECIERKRYMIESYYYLALIASLQNDIELLNEYKMKGLSIVSLTNINEEFTENNVEIISSYVAALNKL